jgi:farnesyl diphosphate synthase
MDLLRDSSLLDEARMLNVFARWSIGLIGLYQPIRKAGFTSAAALVVVGGNCRMNIHDLAARPSAYAPHLHKAFNDRRIAGDEALANLLGTLEHISDAVERELDSVLPREDGSQESQLFSAMRYACLAGGKRIRPFLVIATARIFTVPESSALRVAAALEMLHCFSLVHDDLPAMDNAETRRGKPALHRRYDEATAILVGDALLMLSIALLAEHKTHPDPAVRCELIQRLGLAAGYAGMARGQMLDLLAEHRQLSCSDIERMEWLKTGALLSFACEAGAILGEASSAARQALRRYAGNIGVAFQIIDDLLDVESTESETGKTVLADARHGKATLVSKLGAAGARERANDLVESALQALDGLGERANHLRQMALYIIRRRH